MATEFRASTSGFEMGDNKLNSSDRYIRAVADPDDKTIGLVRGPSVGMKAQIVGSNNALEFTWKFDVGGAVVLSSDANSIGYASGFNTSIDGAV